MYEKLPNLAIGFHGCSKEVFSRVINEQEELNASTNDYDWLGNGIYFWENNVERAWEWARNRHGEDAAVVGAVLDLGYCLNLTDSASTMILKTAYDILKAKYDEMGIDLPRNIPSKKTRDILLRNLDCAVIQQAQQFYKDSDSKTKTAFDLVRGVFIEGEPPFPGSALFSKTHIQICICNPNCIKGYFVPRTENTEYRLP